MKGRCDFSEREERREAMMLWIAAPTARSKEREVGWGEKAPCGLILKGLNAGADFDFTDSGEPAKVFEQRVRQHHTVGMTAP